MRGAHAPARRAADPARLCEVEASGVGERTAEGYGQIRFNDPLLTSAPAEGIAIKGDPVADQTIPPALPANDAYACLLERELWKREIRHAALTIASSRARRQEALKWHVEHDKPPMGRLGGLRGKPPMSQLGGLPANSLGSARPKTPG